MILCQKNEESNNGTKSKDIRLIDLIRFIWKWKYIILAGTLVFSLGTGVVEYKKPELYRITTIMQIISNQNIYDGKQLIGLNENFRMPFFQIDSPENIKTSIDLGLLDKSIQDYLRNVRNIDVPLNLKLDADLVGKEGIMKISYKTAQAQHGVLVLDSLKKILLDKYKNKIEYQKRLYIQKIQDEISGNESKIEILKFTIENDSKRIKQLEEDILFLKSNTDLMMVKKSQMLPDKDDNSLAFILYNQTIQKNIELMNTYESDIIVLRNEIEQQKFELKKLVNQNIMYQQEKVQEENRNNENQYIEILESAENNIKPFKKRVEMKLFLGAILGFALATLIAFISEYILCNIRQNKI